MNSGGPKGGSSWGLIMWRSSSVDILRSWKGLESKME